MFVRESPATLPLNWLILQLLERATAVALASSVFGLAFVGSLRAQSISVPLTPGHLIFSQRNFKIPELTPHEHNGEIVDFLGRPSFRLVRGLFYAPDVNFQNGTIDVDVAADNDSRFFGIAFRVESDDDYEVIFFRPGASSTTQAIQYTPAFHGANVWQLYTGPGYTASADIPRNQWIHVRIFVAGLVAKLYLNHETRPTLVVPDLKLGHKRGSIGFWGHMGGGYFSNLTYTPDNTPYTADILHNFLPGTLTDWQLSDMFDVSEKDPAVYPDVGSLKWEPVAAETPGMVVINRYRRSPNIDAPEREDRIRGPVPGSKFVFGKTIIHSDRAEIRKMSLGYSDEVVVFVNGNPIYSGNNTLAFRQSNFLGLLDIDSDAVYLPLKKGDNELVLAVTEFFGGWGFMCKLAPESLQQQE